MKMYSAIEHLIHRNNGEKETREENFIWYKDKNQLIQNVEAHIQEYNEMETRVYDMVNYEIVEHELKTEVLEGLTTNDGSYEDFRVLIGECDIQKLLYKHFTGVKVKVTIDSIE